MPTKIKLNRITCGVDLAAGCNENAVYIVNGSERLFEDHWVDRNTVVTALRLVSIFDDWKSKGLEEGEINIDDGGIGRAIIDQVEEKGWHPNRVLNQSKALFTSLYGNRGGELYFNVKRLAEAGFIILDKVRDELLIKQLSSRRYKKTEGQGKLFLESKKEAIAQGRPSPDRADAFCLAYARVTLQDFLDIGIEKKPFISARVPTQKTVLENLARQKFNNFLRNFTPKNVGPVGPNTHPSNILRALYGK